VNAIETWYGGILFRSRLEAKWAAFFDALRWRWEYEPFDLNGYIPDFVLPDLATRFIVEVKPEVTDEAKAKIKRSGWDGNALIVSSSPGPSRDGGLLLGEMGIRTLVHAQHPERGYCLEWAPGVAQYVGCKCAVGLIYEPFGTCQKCNESPDFFSTTHESTTELTQLWRSACNATRWQPGKAMPAPIPERCSRCNGVVTNKNLAGFGSAKDGSTAYYCWGCVYEDVKDAGR